jgi:methionyl-tRNA synthetase
MAEQIIVTSALPYANGPIHFGHIVGAYLPADIYVRFRRMLGDAVHFVCGTDEHGVAITLKAEQQGVPYEDYVDRWHAEIQDTLRGIGIEFDVFSGTAHHRNPHHQALAQQFFLDLRANGYLLERTEAQFFSEAQQRFLPDRYVEGTCYLCGYEKARGDECPSCGKYLDAKLLKDPRSSLDGTTPVLRDSRHWYLDLARARDEWLRAWFEGKHGTWKPNVENFVLSDLADLRERPITRDLPWGVPVPLPDSEGKVLYVWFDAPIGYLSISRQYWEERGQPERFEQLWKDPATKLFHFIGKDNITFHAVVFPAILHGADRGWILPENVPANEFFNFEGRKFNTSTGWVVPADSVADVPVDALRYALCTMMPETADSEWTWQEFQARVNSDLADNLGNFVSRTLRFVERFFDGAIPAAGAAQPEDLALAEAARGAAAEVREHLLGFRFRRACQAIMALGNECNRYYDTEAPWLAVKVEATRPRAAQVMRVCCEMIRTFAILVAPVMPGTSATLFTALGLGGRAPRFDEIGAIPEPSSGWPAGRIDGAPLTAALPRFVDRKGEEKPALFTKFADERVAQERQRLEGLAAASAAVGAAAGAAAPAEPSFEPVAGLVDFEGFAAVDLRAGTVRAARTHPKADRLLVLEVDLGFETRTIVAGVAASYAPDELIGQRVVAVANLAPRKLRGIESQGMLLATDDAAGRPRFLRPDAGTPDGSRVR